MTYVLVAQDFPGILDRRLAHRDEHLEYVGSFKKQGKVVFGTALLDDEGEMCGSILFFDTERVELDNYLKEEPFVKNQVWDKIEIRECKASPSFLKS